MQVPVREGPGLPVAASAGCGSTSAACGHPLSQSAASIPGHIIWLSVAQVAAVQGGRNPGPALTVRGKHPQLGLRPGRRGNEPSWGLSPGRSRLAQHALLCGTLPEPGRAPTALVRGAGREGFCPPAPQLWGPGLCRAPGALGSRLRAPAP